MKKRFQKKSEVLREGYMQGLRKAQSIITKMLAESNDFQVSKKDFDSKFFSNPKLAKEFLEKICPRIHPDKDILNRIYEQLAEIDADDAQKARTDGGIEIVDGNKTLYVYNDGTFVFTADAEGSSITPIRCKFHFNHENKSLTIGFLDRYCITSREQRAMSSALYKYLTEKYHIKPNDEQFHGFVSTLENSLYSFDDKTISLSSDPELFKMLDSYAFLSL